MTLYIVIIATEINYCSAVSRNYGGKTREIIIIIINYFAKFAAVW